MSINALIQQKIEFFSTEPIENKYNIILNYLVCILLIKYYRTDMIIV